MIFQITAGKNFSQKSIPVLVSALLDTTDDPDLILKVDEILKAKKESLGI